jgi:hypothetical protein
MICAVGFALDGTRFFGNFTSAGGVADALHHTVGYTAGAFFAVILLNASLIGAGAVTLATSYVIGDVFGTRGSLHRSFGEAKGFYSVFIVLIVFAAGIVLVPGAPLAVITEAVQALCGIVLPMTTLFLLMLCNDREVLGPWTNPTWLKALAAVIVAVLMLLSVVLTLTTLFPSINVSALFLSGSVVVVVALVVMGVNGLRNRGPGAGHVTFLDSGHEVPREQWTMPPAALLSRPYMPLARRAGLYVLGGYMVIALIMLVVKSIQIATS